MSRWTHPPVWDRILSVGIEVCTHGMKVEFLFFEGCPSHEVALARLRKVLRETRTDADVSILRVESEDEARELGFPGSPTIRIEGRDIDPAGAAQPVGLTCRVYRTPDGGYSPLPSEATMRQAILDRKRRT